MRRLVVAAVLLPALAACGSDGGPTVARRQLPRLVLQPSDLPARYARVEAGRLGLVDFAPGPREDPRRFGRIGGWKARYEAAGPASVASYVDLFESAGDAKDDLKAYKTQFEGEVVDSDGAEQFVDVPKLGEGTYATTIAVGRLRDYRIAWRFGNVTASVLLEGLNGSVRLRDAIALARKQQRRLEAAAPSE
jgi:hypothetical protein